MNGFIFSQPSEPMSAVGCKYVWHIVDDNVGGASEKFKGIHRRTPGRFPRGLAEFITRAFEEDMAIGLDMPPQEKYTSTSSGVRTTTTRDMSKESAM